jgi:hypothetical protein
VPPLWDNIRTANTVFFLRRQNLLPGLGKSIGFSTFRRNFPKKMTNAAAPFHRGFVDFLRRFLHIISHGRVLSGIALSAAIVAH